MFTAVYLCYSPASQLWLAPFTRPQLQLQLNKTSNRDTRPLCLSFSPCPLKMISHTAMGEKRKNKMLKMLSVTFFFPILLPIYSLALFTPLSNPTLWRIRSSNIPLPTHPPGPHVLSRKPPSEYFSSSLCLCLCFCRKTVLFMSWRPAAVCELKVVVSGLGLDHIRLKNIELFAFFPL